jgi:hypothetical protein
VKSNRILHFILVMFLVRPCPAELSRERSETGVAADLPAPVPCASADVWLVSSRRLPHVACRAPVDCVPAFSRWQNGCLVRSSRDEFLQTLPPQPASLCIFVHGNRVSPGEDLQQGLTIYRRLACDGGTCRFVIWAWPSDKVPGPVRDARIKADRSDAEAVYLAKFLADFSPDLRVSLVGYSLGARAITGSLQLLAGGQWCGTSLDTAVEQHVRPRVALLAPAVARHWILPRGVHGQALQQSERLIAFFNPRDPVLKHFDVVFKPGRPQALGYQGIAATQLGPAAAQFQQYNVSNDLGHTHSFDRYVSSRCIMGLVRRELFEPAVIGDSTGL